MNITTFGTCRIDGVIGNNNINNLISYVHSTKEIIQLIKFLKGEIIIDYPYNILCFRTAICNNQEIKYNNNYKQLFDNTDIFIIEICSKKLYIHNNYYLHHLCVDKRFKDYNKNTPDYIINNFTLQTQNDEEIINDIILIKKLIDNKKLLIITHYNSKDLNNNYFNDRNNLINLVEDTCYKNNIYFLNPTNITKNYSQDIIMTNDLGHYTEFGKDIVLNYINDFIKKI